MQKIIPYHKIDRGSKVLFYGAGNNCAWCYENLIKNGYCKLVGIVDKSPEGKCVEGISAVSIETLYNEEYDYLLITVVNSDVLKSIKRELQRLGVSGEKIVTCHDYEEQFQLDDLSNFSRVQQYLQDKFERLHIYKKCAYEYYPSLNELFCSCIEDKYKLLDKLKNLLSELKYNEATFVLLNLMFDCNVFDSACMQHYMQCMLQMKWKDDTCYGHVIDTTIMVFCNAEYIYSDFFRDRKLLYQKIVAHYDLKKIKRTIADENNNKKIALVVRRYTPDVITDAPSKIIQSYALGFVERGYEVKIFVLSGELKAGDKNIFLQRKYGRDNYKDCAIEEDAIFSNKRIEIEISKEKDTKERLQGTVAKIMKYSPRFILDMADEYFPEAGVLIDYFPIINFPMRGNAYSSVADLYITGDINRVITDNEKYKAVPLSKLRKVQLANLGISTKEPISYVREELGWDKTDFLIVTVGTRLWLDIDSELFETMCCFLEKESRFKWILVGGSLKSQDERFKRLVEKNKIIEWGFEENLEALYKICDVYLNPKRLGGGVSIRLAMKQGLPIAMLDSASDVRARMKPEHLIQGGYAELVQYIKELHINQNLYFKISSETKKIIEDLIEESDYEKVLRICEEAVLLRKGREND